MFKRKKKYNQYGRVSAYKDMDAPVLWIVASVSIGAVIAKAISYSDPIGRFWYQLGEFIVALFGGY